MASPAVYLSGHKALFARRLLARSQKGQPCIHSMTLSGKIRLRRRIRTTTETLDIHRPNDGDGHEVNARTWRRLTCGARAPYFCEQSNFISHGIAAFLGRAGWEMGDPMQEASGRPSRRKAAHQGRHVLHERTGSGHSGLGEGRSDQTGVSPRMTALAPVSSQRAGERPRSLAGLGGGRSRRGFSSGTCERASSRGGAIGRGRRYAAAVKAPLFCCRGSVSGLSSALASSRQSLGDAGAEGGASVAWPG